MKLVELHGATYDESSGDREYKERGRVWINPDRIECVYDHTVMLRENKIRVMETGEEIIKCLTCEECGS